MTMLTLYYCPGACSMASHIALEETKASYQVEPIELAKKEQKTEMINDRNLLLRASHAKLKIAADGPVLAPFTGF